jgi:phosphate-selective porin OprO/OprP
MIGITRTGVVLTLGVLAVARPISVRAQTGTESGGDSTRVGEARAGSVRRDSLDVLITDLEARIAALERASAATTQRAPSVTMTRDGLAISSADNAFGVRLRGYVQGDGRFFGASGAAQSGTNAFVLRRARVILDATAYRYFGFRISPDLGGGQVTLQDAYVEARPATALAVRVGKFRPPVGLERQQPATDQRFVERGLPSNLSPSRDVGVQLYGEAVQGLVQYQVAALDGAPDGANIDGDASTGKDIAARVLVRPLVTSVSSVDLGLGIGGSRGSEQGTVNAPALGSYRTTGQLALFRFRGDGTEANTVVADGRRTRLIPQGFLYSGRLGMLGEYMRTTHTVRRAGRTAALTMRAWQLSGGWALTGDHETFSGFAPSHPLDGSGAGGRGALELVARYGVLTIDAGAFPTFADPATQARRARAAGVGLNWRLTRGVQLAANYERTQLDGPEAARARSTEHAVLTRFQLGF